jgi:hypothetical protein
MGQLLKTSVALATERALQAKEQTSLTGISFRTPFELSFQAATAAAAAGSEHF